MKNSILAVGLLSLAMNVLTSSAQAATPVTATDGTDFVLFVEVKVKPDTVADFKAAILSIVDATQAEDGNLAYIVHQSPDDPTDFMVYEHWESDLTHNLHLASPGFVSYSHTVAPMIQSGYPVRKRMVELN